MFSKKILLIFGPTSLLLSAFCFFTFLALTSSSLTALTGNEVDASLLNQLTIIANSAEAGLKNIKDAAQDTINDIKQFFNVTGLPAAVGRRSLIRTAPTE